MQKLQLSITDQENEVLELKAKKWGRDAAWYVKYLIAQEVADIEKYKMTSEMESKVKEALEENEDGTLPTWNEFIKQ